MKEKSLDHQKKDLIEKLGVHFEKEIQLPPLASRIIATLILNGSSGITFEQLVTNLEASKSTIFTHLTSLEAQQRIQYFTKCGDRKRYYIISPGFINRKIEALLLLWNNEIKLQKEILAYLKAFNKIHVQEPKSLTVHENALDFLSNTVKYFKEQIGNFQIKNNKHNS